MKDFKQLFDQSNNAPADAIYNGRHIFSADKFPVSNKDILMISIESTNSKYIQGFCIGVYGSIIVKGERHKKGKYINMLFWEDTEILDPKNIEIQVFSNEGFVFIKNIWEAESIKGEKTACYVGSREWLMGRGSGAAMYSEEIEGGWRYFCNDGDLDDIIFTVRKNGNVSSK